MFYVQFGYFSGRKKPVGGASLNVDGGADLFASTKKQITEEPWKVGL